MTPLQLCGVVMVGIATMSVSIAVGQVFQHPKSKLVAAGVEVMFQCQLADQLTSYWVIDLFPGVPENLEELQNRGYSVSESSRDGIATLSLRVTATIDKDGTVIFCSSEESVRTNTAVLMVIENPPISPNPSAENSNATSILLKWSPPFLWPDHSIDFYNISVMNSGLITQNYLLNATFDDALVPFTIFAEDNNIESCQVLEILLSAVSSDAQDLTTFHVNGSFIPTPSKSDFTDLDITVLFRSDRTPIMNINIYLSERICSHSSFNYTFVIDANSSNESTLGPYQQVAIGSNVISKVFMSEFKKDRDYSLTVVIDTIAGIIISDTNYFTTTLQHQMYPCRDQQQHDENVYKLVMIISLCVVVLMSLIFIMFTIRAMLSCIRERHGKRIIESTREVHNAMVQNPIYEGPYYETLDAHAQLRTVDTLAAATKNASLDHTTQSIANEASSNSTNSSPTLHYVKQPCVAKNNSSHALVSISEGHSTGEHHHTFQFSEKGNGILLNLTATIADNTEEKYMTMTQANTTATNMINH